MKFIKIALFCSLFCCSVSSALADSPLGRWTTIDDKTGDKRAIVELFLAKDGELKGKIIETFPYPGESKVCTKCPGDFKGKLIKGLVFMWGLKDKGHDLWDGGSVLDAKTGKIYHVRLKVKGDKLLVRGYIGIAMIGRTQVWER